MKTFGTLISEARRAKGLSRKDLAAKVKKKEDGQAISAQHLNDIEHDRRNPPSEFLIVQMAEFLAISKDGLLLAAGTIPEELQRIAQAQPDKVGEAFKTFRKTVKENK
jgi:transcriptional regulator with XRE-family HTH domain